MAVGPQERINYAQSLLPIRSRGFKKLSFAATNKADKLHAQLGRIGMEIGIDGNFLSKFCYRLSLYNLLCTTNRLPAL